MSHKALVRVRIENPVRSILEEAVRLLAKELGVEAIENATVEGWAFKEQVDWLLPLRTSYGNGYGVKIEGGEVKVVADVHSRRDTELMEKIQGRLQQYYVAVAAQKSLQEMGYRVTIQPQEDEVLVVAEQTGWSVEGW